MQYYSTEIIVLHDFGLEDFSHSLGLGNYCLKDDLQYCNYSLILSMITKISSFFKR